VYVIIYNNNNNNKRKKIHQIKSEIFSVDYDCKLFSSVFSSSSLCVDPRSTFIPRAKQTSNYRLSFFNLAFSLKLACMELFRFLILLFKSLLNLASIIQYNLSKVVSSVSLSTLFTIGEKQQRNL
jgi:hypothetical protein